MSERRKPVPKAFAEFQPDGVEIEERRLPKGARAMFYALALLLAAAVAWASLAEIDRVVTAEGKLVPAERPLVVQPLDKSIIVDFHVELGDRVEKGAPLVTLDSTVARADLEQLEARRDSLQVQSRRLAAELAEAPFDPTGLPPGEDLALQSAILESRRLEYRSRLDAWQRRLEGLEAGIDTLAATREQVAKQLAMAEEVDEIYATLVEKGVSSKLEAINARTRRIDFESRLEELTNKIAELEKDYAQVESERDAFITNWRNAASEQLLAVQRELDEVTSMIDKARWMQERVVLRAPEAGVVQDMAKLGRGAVVNEAEPLVTLVPADSEVLAEVAVLDKDIGRVRPGDVARIKLSAFPFQTHGTLEGVVRTVSEDSFSRETPQGESVFYRVRIELGERRLNKIPEDFRLQPGMLARAEITVGKRSVISYFLYPVLRSLDETLREP